MVLLERINEADEARHGVKARLCEGAIFQSFSGAQIRINELKPTIRSPNIS